MKQRTLAGTSVGEIGLGCMNLSHGYGRPPTPEAARALLMTALDAGVTHFDTAAVYGFGRNEELVGEVMSPFRKRIFLASKCGLTGVDGQRKLDGRPETLKRTCDEALARLRTDVIDLYYLHRLDKDVPIEDSTGALADLVAAGKVRAIGLSEMSAATLRRAHAVHPIAAVQSEYSLWTRNPELGLFDACRALNVSLVAFSPVGRGFLAGGVTAPEFLGGDLRIPMPRFMEPNFSRNLALLEGLRAIAAAEGATPAQISLSWLLGRGDFVHVIPGTTQIAHLMDNLGASGVVLSAATRRRLDDLINQSTVAGARYPAAVQREIDTEEFS